MADSLILTGVKDVKKQTGNPKEMLLTRPKRGGDTHSIREWWKAGASKCYVECTVFDVTVGGNTVKLAIDTNMSTNLRIDHDGSFGFTFFGSNEVRRAALFTSSYELIEHYVFPAISGGKVMTVTPANGADRPTPAPPPVPDTTIGTVEVVENDPGETLTDGGQKTYNVTITGGDAGNLSYAWSANGAGATINGSATGTSATFDLATGSAVIICAVESGDANVTNSPQTDSVSITVT